MNKPSISSEGDKDLNFKVGIFFILHRKSLTIIVELDEIKISVYIHYGLIIGTFQYNFLFNRSDHKLTVVIVDAAGQTLRELCHFEQSKY